MDLLKKERIPFGFSSVVTSESAATLGDDAVISGMIDRGCTVGFFNELIPIGPEDNDLVPDTAQRKWFAERVSHLRKAHPLVLINLPADEYDDNGRCMSVGSGAVHITSSGDVEPCPFAHYARENVMRCSFRDILYSPFLEAIRNHPTALRCGEIGCALVNNRALLEEIASETGARSTNVPAVGLDMNASKR
jgi:MoaA/NifB/PqqE/SkfB family radical SAM enzyme